MQFGLLIAQILTLQSSPPVASKRPDDFPNTSEDTLLEWATISSEQHISQSHLSQLQMEILTISNILPCTHAVSMML